MRPDIHDHFYQARKAGKNRMRGRGNYEKRERREKILEENLKLMNSGKSGMGMGGRRREKAN
jgi:hypothetical protein